MTDDTKTTGYEPRIVLDSTEWSHMIAEVESDLRERKRAGSLKNESDFLTGAMSALWALRVESPIVKRWLFNMGEVANMEPLHVEERDEEE